MQLWHHTKRISRTAAKHTGRILFPYVWHYITDDYKDQHHHLVVDSILSLLILFLLASNIILAAWFYTFSIYPAVTVDLTVPDVVISGSDLAVDVAVTSINKHINQVSLKLVLPSGYTPITPAAWKWDQLAAGQTQTEQVTGHFIGTVDKPYRVIAVYEYSYYGQKYSGFTTVEFVVDTSSLEVVAHLPEQILNQELFSWTIEYYNSSKIEHKDVCIMLDIPDSFSLESSSAEITDSRIVLPSLPAQSGGEVTITGSFKNVLGEGSHIIGVRGVDDCTNQQYEQIVVSTPIQVLTPRLAIATSGPISLNVGDTGRYTVRYTNTGDATLSIVHITSQLQNFAGHYRSISLSGGGTITGDTLNWTDTNLVPGETRYQTFTVATNPGMREKNVAMSYTAKATADIADLGVTTYTPTISGATTKFNSTLRFSTVARYYSTAGEQLGYGPYPPRAWDVTALRVFWQVEDFTNDLSNVTMSATLPSQVEWTGHSAVTEGGAMTYDPTTRRVTWHTGSIPSFSHAQGASFEVRILPNSDQVGKSVNIINDTAFTARDSFTGVVLSRLVGALRTPPVEAEN